MTLSSQMDMAMDSEAVSPELIGATTKDFVIKYPSV